MSGLDALLQQTTRAFRDDRPRGTRSLTEQELRLEHLRRISPEAYELVIQLPEEYQQGLTLFFPIHGEEPFVGVEIDGKGVQPADPLSYSICNRLLEMLREENPSYLEWGMEHAKRQRSLYPAYMPDPSPEDLLDVEATVVE